MSLAFVPPLFAGGSGNACLEGEVEYPQVAFSDGLWVWNGKAGVRLHVHKMGHCCCSTVRVLIKLVSIPMYDDFHQQQMIPERSS